MVSGVGCGLNRIWLCVFASGKNLGSHLQADEGDVEAARVRRVQLHYSAAREQLRLRRGQHPAAAGYIEFPQGVHGFLSASGGRSFVVSRLPERTCVPRVLLDAGKNEHSISCTDIYCCLKISDTVLCV